MTSTSQTLLSNTSTVDAQQTRDDQDEVVGHMDEDNELPQIASTVNKMDDDNSESPLATDEQSPTTKEDIDQPIDEPIASHINRVVSAPTMPIAISRNIDIPGKNDSNILFSVMETSSLGKENTSRAFPSFSTFVLFFLVDRSGFDFSSECVECR